MKSITTKISVAMMLCMVAAVTLVSLIYMGQTRNINEDSSQKLIALLCDDSAKAMDAQFLVLERAMTLLAQHSTAFLRDTAHPLAERFDTLEAMSLQSAETTAEAFSVYFHSNPDKYPTDADFYYIRDTRTGSLEKQRADHPCTFIEQPNPGADWYFASAQSGQPCWLPPYIQHDDEGKEIVVASYTVPLFDAEGDLLGVLGMDYAFQDMLERLVNIGYYDEGYAFLVSADGSIVFHPTLPFGALMIADEPDFLNAVALMAREESAEELFRYRFEGVDKRMTFAPLRNGTYLMVSVPIAEVNASIDRMTRESLILFAVVQVSSVMIIYCIIYRFIRPLQLLTYASQQIIKGNMHVSLPYHADDEIGELTENFRQMETFLQEHIAQINALAHTDAMTGLKNKTAYQAAVNLLESQIKQGFSDFAVVVFDLNNLKYANDTLGHAAGDKIIKSAALIIGKSFSHSPVFRVGGDEFVAILENDDLHDYADCAARLDQKADMLNARLKREEQVSIAYGMARFDDTQDKTYRDVFIRADRAMYRHKQAIKRENYSAAGEPLA